MDFREILKALAFSLGLGGCPKMSQGMEMVAAALTAGIPCLCPKNCRRCARSAAVSGTAERTTSNADGVSTDAVTYLRSNHVSNRFWCTHTHGQLPVSRDKQTIGPKAKDESRFLDGHR
eukprot:s1908_g10.t1